MTNATAQQEITSTGYLRLANAYSEEVLPQLKTEAEALIKRHYTKENLGLHSVYPSDSTDTRVSHAMMLAEAQSQLPMVDHDNSPAIHSLLGDHNQLLAELTGRTVAPSARYMLNFQQYFSGSKPVGEHFDGEYIRARKAEDGVEFHLLEGILPRFVAVLVLENQNNGIGTELVDNKNGAVHKPRMDPGDLLIFDNIRLRHRVPRLEKPRTTLGLRNFDHMAVHFAHEENAFIGNDYRKIAEGWVSETVDCQARFHSFMRNEWPDMKADYEHYF